LAGGLD